MVRKGGFEPPRLSAPPPQDGVSASSTTSALQPLFANRLRENRRSARRLCQASNHRADYQLHAHPRSAGCVLSLYTRSNVTVQVGEAPTGLSWPLCTAPHVCVELAMRLWWDALCRGKDLGGSLIMQSVLTLLVYECSYLFLVANLRARRISFRL